MTKKSPPEFVNKMTEGFNEHYTEYLKSTSPTMAAAIEYQEQFLNGDRFCSDHTPYTKRAYISDEMHTLLIRMSNCMGGKGKVTIGSYLTAIVQEHFDTHADTIREVYELNTRNAF